MEKDKAIFFGVVGGVMLILIIYSFIAFGKNPDKNAENARFEAPAIDIEKTKYLYNSRVDALTREQYETPERENPLRYNFLEESHEEKKTEPSKETEKEPEAAKKTRQTIRRQGNNNTQEPVVKKIPSQDPPAPEQEKNQEPEQIAIRYSFSTGENTQEAGQNTAPQKEENHWAQLDEKAVVRNNSCQVFLLERSASIGGKVFPPNSKLYTRAVVKKDYIDILVHRIKDINTGEEYNVDLYAVNENRSRGIKYQGRTNRETDKTSQNIVSESMQAIYRRYDIDEIAGAAGEGLEEIAGRDEVEVPIGRGYRLIFIENINP